MGMKIIRYFPLRTRPENLVFLSIDGILKYQYTANLFLQQKQKIYPPDFMCLLLLLSQYLFLYAQLGKHEIAHECSLLLTVLYLQKYLKMLIQTCKVLFVNIETGKNAAQWKENVKNTINAQQCSVALTKNFLPTHTFCSYEIMASLLKLLVTQK